MRIIMIGAGAMGGVFGARFVRAGVDIVLYDHDAEHVAAIKETGLYVSTPTGDIRLPIPATTEISTVGPVDGAIVLVDSNATTPRRLPRARCAGGRFRFDAPKRHRQCRGTHRSSRGGARVGPFDLRQI